MDEVLQKLASVGLGNLSPAQLASILGPEKMALLEQTHGLSSLRAQAAPSLSSQQQMFDLDAESFKRERKQDIEHAKEVLEASRQYLPLPRADQTHTQRELKATPVPILTLPRRAMINAMQDDINSYRPASKYQPQFRQTFDDGRSRFSSQPLSQLKQMSISELSVPRHHEGKYLFCRVVTSIKQVVACMLLVDDPSGDCTTVGVYHLVANPSLSGPPLDSQLPIGTKIAIREPYVKISGGGGGQPFVRVDSPTDIVIFKDDDPRCKGVTWRYDGSLRRVNVNKSAENYKAMGNTAFQRKDYYSALAAYEHALEARGAQQIHGALYSNISATCLHLSKPGRAYLSAKAALVANLAEPHMVAKALFRQASAAYQLHCFNEAESLFKRGLAVAESDAKAQGLAKEFNEYLARTSERLRERDTGVYDFHAMFSNVIAGGPNPRPDVADFVGPVEIRSSPSGSRGLHVTRDVAAGELLLVSKSVSGTSRKDAEIENVFLMAYNLVNSRLREETHFFNTTKLIHLCIDNPAFYSAVCHLYDGNPPSSSSLPPLGMVDTEKQVIEQLGVVVDVDVGRLERVMVFNSFGDCPFHIAAEAKESAEFRKENKVTSLFYLPSFCNHSCVPNGTRILFGDVMVVRALSPLSQGDEITLGYISPEISIDERNKTLQQAYGFQCDCWYCREEKMDGEAAYKRRKKIFDTELPKAKALVHQATGSAQDGNYDAALFSPAFKAIENIKDKIEATYHPERGPPRLEMYRLWRVLSSLHSWKEPRKSIEDEKRALVALGAVITDGALIKKGKGKGKGSNSKPIVMMSRLPLLLDDGGVHSILAIAAHHNTLGELALQRNWVATAVWAHDMAMGGGLPVLKKWCPDDLKYVL